MKQSKNSNLNKPKREKISLEDFVLFCVEKTIEIASYTDEDLGSKVEEATEEKYKLGKWVVPRLYSPVFHYLTLRDYNYNTKEGKIKVLREPLIPSDGQIRWHITEKAKKLTEKEKKKIAEKITSEHKEYFKGNIEKFNLDNLFQ